jgi:hypothetical protein
MAPNMDLVETAFNLSAVAAGCYTAADPRGWRGGEEESR